MVKAECSLVSRHNKINFYNYKFSKLFGQKNNNTCIGYNLFPGNYTLNAKHSHVSQHKAASIGHHEEVWLHCPTHTNTHTYTYIHTRTHTCIHTFIHDIVLLHDCEGNTGKYSV